MVQHYGKINSIPMVNLRGFVSVIVHLILLLMIPKLVFSGLSTFWPSTARLHRFPNYGNLNGYNMQMKMHICNHVLVSVISISHGQ